MTSLQVFDFNSNAVRVIMKNDEPWFVANNVCRVLSISNTRDAISRLDTDERDVGNSDTLGGKQ
jgi:hypothetical protein